MANGASPSWLKKPGSGERLTPEQQAIVDARAKEEQANQPWYKRLPDQIIEGISKGLTGDEFNPSGPGRWAQLATETAVMAPFLRGNKLLQQARLDKLRLPEGPVNEALQVMKQRYPRAASHLSGVELATDSPSSAGQYVSYPFSSIGVNPNVNISPTAATETVGHEFRHLGQSVANKNFDEAYRTYQQAGKYVDIPYEQAARLGSTRDVIKKVLGDRWNDIPAKLRTNFTKAIHSNPDFSNIMEGRVNEIIKENPNTRALSIADDLSTKTIESFYEAFKRKNLLKSGKKSIVNVTPIKKDIPGTTPATNAGPYKPLDFFLEPQYRGYLQNPFFARR